MVLGERGSDEAIRSHPRDRGAGGSDRGRGGEGVGNDSPQGCTPGEWVKVTTVEPNGDTDTTVLRHRLPEGYSTTSTGDGPQVTINSDGSVDAPAGSTLECIAPTH